MLSTSNDLVSFHNRFFFSSLGNAVDGHASLLRITPQTGIHVDETCKCLLELDISSQRLGLLCFLYFLALLTILSNLAFIFSVVPYKKLQTSSNFLLVSNSVADIFVGLYVLPVAVTLWLFHECWPLEHWVCLLYYASKEHFIAASVVHMTAIAIERYLRLLHSDCRFYKICFKKRLGWTISFCWMYPSGTSYFRTFIPYFTNLYPYDTGSLSGTRSDTCSVYNHQACNCVQCFTPVSFAVESLLQYIIPMIIMFTCYGRIIMVTFCRIKKSHSLHNRINSSLELRLSSISQPPAAATRNIRAKFLRTKEFRSIRLFLIILIAFVIPWGPHAVNKMMSAFGYSTMDSAPMQGAHESGDLSSESYATLPYRTFRSLIYVLGYSNSLGNPLLLFLLSKNFRLGFRRTCGRCIHNGRTKDNNADSFEGGNSKWNHYARALSTK